MGESEFLYAAMVSFFIRAILSINKENCLASITGSSRHTNNRLDRMKNFLNP